MGVTDPMGIGRREEGDGPVIRLEVLTKRYPMGERGTVEAIRGLDLEVRRGEYVAIMGPSGSGKSSLMNILGCLDRPSSGRYWLDGRDVSQLGDREQARVRNERIGFVFQSFNLLPRATALENVELPLVYRGVPAKERHARAMAALASVGIAGRASHRPSELSGGECQRVAIARALVTRPSLLLADEPTGNLDSANTAEILALFREIHAKGNTIIVVTHEESVAFEAARVVRMRDGRIVQDGRGGS
ncbi:MAG: ABC transporter ATP-binding protein [Planctomycetota bacterium]